VHVGADLEMRGANGNGKLGGMQYQ